ncbi:MAG: TIR domain-containing protein [Verrucomicrobia bacterium]|nr:TIR domain-containing protein [Verrucomicrobiota bacterium]
MKSAPQNFKGATQVSRGGRCALFVNYARKDDKRGYVRRFVEALAAEYEKRGKRKLEYFFDLKIPKGKKWKKEILDAVRQRPVLLPIVSKAYFDSDWCWHEWNLYRREVKDTLRCVLPIWISEVRRVLVLPQVPPLRRSSWWTSLMQLQGLELIRVRPGSTKWREHVRMVASILLDRTEHAELNLKSPPKEFCETRQQLKVGDIRWAARRLSSIILQSQFYPDIILGVNASGMAAASMMSRFFLRSHLGVISTRKLLTHRDSERPRDIGCVSLPGIPRQNSSGQTLPTVNACNAERMLVVDGKCKSGKSALEIVSFLRRKFGKKLDVRFAFVLVYRGWDPSVWSGISGPRNYWPAEHKQNGIVAYMAYYTDKVSTARVDEELYPGVEML